jgi:hypothetical protein
VQEIEVALLSLPNIYALLHNHDVFGYVVVKRLQFYPATNLAEPTTEKDASIKLE